MINQKNYYTFVISVPFIRRSTSLSYTLSRSTLIPYLWQYVCERWWPTMEYDRNTTWKERSPDSETSRMGIVVK